jgi:Na+/H+ antiporter NhaA
MNLRTLLKELMKYSLLGLFLQCMFLSLLVASDLEAQNYQSVKEIYISVKLKDASLKETFNWINKNTDLHFNYDRIHVEDLDTKDQLIRKTMQHWRIYCFIFPKKPS